MERINEIDEALVHNIFNELSDKFKCSMNHVSLTHLLFCLEDKINGTRITKKYEGFSPMEFLTEYKINLMCAKGEIDEATKLKLLTAYHEYTRSDKRIYYADTDLKHNLKQAIESGSISEKTYGALLESHINYWKDWKKINSDILGEYKLPIVFDLDELVDKYNGVTTDKSYNSNDELGITYNQVKRKFNHIFYESNVSTPLEQIANPTKEYGKYSKYTVIEFLTIAKIIYKWEVGSIEVETRDMLLNLYDRLLQINEDIRYNKDDNQLPTLVANQKEIELELKKYHLPLEFDLDGIIDAYGKDLSKGKEKIK